MVFKLLFLSLSLNLCLAPFIESLSPKTNLHFIEQSTDYYKNKNQWFEGSSSDTLKPVSFNIHEDPFILHSSPSNTDQTNSPYCETSFNENTHPDTIIDLSHLDFPHSENLANTPSTQTTDEEQHKVLEFIKKMIEKMGYFLRYEVLGPVNALPALYINLLRIGISFVSISLYSWQGAIAFLGTHLILFGLHKLFSLVNSKFLANLLSWALIAGQILAHPRIFFTSLSGALFVSFSLYLLNKILKVCGASKEYIEQTHRILISSFVFSWSQLTLEMFIPEWTLNIPQVPQPSNSPDICNGIKGLCDKPVLNITGAVASHNFDANWPVLSMQKGDIYQQLLDGARIFHTKYHSSFSTENCQVVTGLGDLQGFVTFSNLTDSLNSMARFLNGTQNELVLFILDDMRLRHPDYCLINTLQNSDLFPLMFPEALQIGEKFNPTIREILNTGHKVVMFYFNFVDNLENQFHSFVEYSITNPLSSNTTLTRTIPFTKNITNLANISHPLQVPLIRSWLVKPDNYTQYTDSIRYDWNFLGSTSALNRNENRSPYFVTWNLLNWKKLQISDVFSTFSSNIVRGQGTRNLTVATNYGAESLIALSSALYNTHLQEYIAYLIKNNIVPSVVLMNHFKFSNFFELTACLNNVANITNFQSECHLPNEVSDRVFIFLSQIFSRTLIYPSSNNLEKYALIQREKKEKSPLLPYIVEPNEKQKHFNVNSPSKSSLPQQSLIEKLLSVPSTLVTPIYHPPNTYLELIRLTHNLLSAGLYSYWLAIGIGGTYIGINIANRYLPKHLKKAIQHLFLILRIVSRPVQFSISLGAAWSIMLPCHGINCFVPGVIAPHIIQNIGSTIFGLTQLSIEFFFPMLYLESHPYSNEYQKSYNQVLSSNKTLKDVFLFGSHDSLHNTPYINVQQMSLLQQVESGANLLHLEIINRSSNANCGLWVIHGGTDISWDLKPLPETLENLYDILEKRPLPFITIIFDDVEINPQNLPCLVETYKNSSLYSITFPQTLQLGVRFNPPIKELSNTGFKVFPLYRTYNLEHNYIIDGGYKNKTFTPDESISGSGSASGSTSSSGSGSGMVSGSGSGSGMTSASGSGSGMTSASGSTNEAGNDLNIDLGSASNVDSGSTPINSSSNSTLLDPGPATHNNNPLPPLNPINLFPINNQNSNRVYETVVIGSNKLNVDVRRIWQYLNGVTDRTACFLGSTSSSQGGYGFYLLDWKAFQIKELYTTKVLNYPNGPPPSPYILGIMSHFGTLSWFASTSQLYNYNLFAYLDFLIENNIMPHIFMINHFEFSHIKLLISCLNSIEQPENYRTLCQLPNEQQELLFAILDRFCTSLPLTQQMLFEPRGCFYKRRQKKMSFSDAYPKEGETYKSLRERIFRYPRHCQNINSLSTLINRCA